MSESLSDPHLPRDGRGVGYGDDLKHHTLQVNCPSGTLASEAQVTRTTGALEANGISVLRAADAAEAKQMVLGLIPDGSQVHHGAS